MSLSMDIIIPTYNRPELLPALLTSLIPQCGINDGIVIVYQGNTAPSGDFPPTVKVVSMPKPNLPAARNAGVNASNADVVLFLDDDCEPFPGLVEAHRSFHVENSISGVAGFVDDPLFDRAQPLPSHIDLSTGNCIQNFSLPQSGPTISAMGANMSFKRKALLDIGGFDTHYRSNALWEEIDCCLRILAKGGILYYCAEAKVRHLRRNSGGCRQYSGYRYLFHQFANTAYFASRFADPRSYGSWLRFWKYRLEYLSRVPEKKSVMLRHDPLAVLAGTVGAAAGIIRFLKARILRSGARFRIDRKRLHRAFEKAGIP